MSDSMRLILRDADVEEFARTSGDVNPLHTDAEFSRRTPYGRPIAHGALVVIAALRVLPADRFSGLTVLGARFAGPVVTGATYEVACSAPRRVPSGSRSTVTVSDATKPVLVIVPLWALNIAYTMWMYWEGLRLNAGVSARGSRRWWEPPATIMLSPVFALLESVSGLLGFLKFARRTENKFVVIAKPT